MATGTPDEADGRGARAREPPARVTFAGVGDGIHGLLATALRLTAVLVVVSASAGCGFGERPTVEEARVVVEAEPGSSLVMMTSMDFLATENEVGEIEITVFRADSAGIDPPVERTFDLTGSQRFLVEVLPPDEETEAGATLRVFIDGEQKFDRSSSNLQERRLRFIFVFNRSVGDTEVRF